MKNFLRLCAVALFLSWSAAGSHGALLDYSNERNWVLCQSGASEKQADVFLLSPTVYMGSPGAWSMSVENERVRRLFTGAVMRQSGIYNGNARVFAPFYRQAGLGTYGFRDEDHQAFIEYAYRDVRDAFGYYMAHYNKGRPIVLAGFSQGGEMCLRLMKDLFCDSPLMKQLVACYAIGWRVYPADVEAFADLKIAGGESDTGVIITYNTEAEWVKSSSSLPEGVKILGVNPLNWRNDSTYADKSLNKGSCFPDATGAIVREIPAYTGAYLDPVRGTLKVTDADPEDFQLGKRQQAVVAKGRYHTFDYRFFYRNLQENVGVRIKAFLGKK